MTHCGHWLSYAMAEVVEIPTSLALWAAGASIVVKEAMYQFTMRVARRDNSPVLIANAWHHRSDALSSVVAFPAVAGALFNVIGIAI